MPDFETGTEGPEEEADPMEVENDDEVMDEYEENTYRMMLLADEPPDNYMRPDKEQYAEYRVAMQMRGTSVGTYLREEILALNGALNESTDRNARWEMQIQIQEYLQIQKNVATGGPADRRKAVRYTWWRVAVKEKE